MSSGDKGEREREKEKRSTNLEEESIDEIPVVQSTLKRNDEIHSSSFEPVR